MQKEKQEGRQEIWDISEELFTHGMDQSFVTLYNNLYNGLSSRYNSWSVEEILAIKISLAMITGLLPRGSFRLYPSLEMAQFYEGNIHIEVSNSINWAAIIKIYKTTVLANVSFFSSQPEIKTEVEKMTSTTTFIHTTKSSTQNIFDDQTLKWFLRSALPLEIGKRELIWKPKFPSLFLHYFQIPTLSRSLSPSSSSFLSPHTKSDSKSPISPSTKEYDDSTTFFTNKRKLKCHCTIHFVFNLSLSCPLHQECDINEYKQWSHWTDLYSRRKTLFGTSNSSFISIDDLIVSITDALLTDEKTLQYVFDNSLTNKVLLKCAQQTTKLCNYLYNKRIMDLLTEINLFDLAVSLESYQKQSNSQTLCEYFKFFHATYPTIQNRNYSPIHTLQSSRSLSSSSSSSSRSFSVSSSSSSSALLSSSTADISLFPIFFNDSPFNSVSTSTSSLSAKSSIHSSSSSFSLSSFSSVPSLSSLSSLPSFLINSPNPFSPSDLSEEDEAQLTTFVVFRESKTPKGSIEDKKNKEKKEPPLQTKSLSSPTSPLVIPVHKTFSSHTIWLNDIVNKFLFSMLFRLSYQYNEIKLAIESTSIKRSSYCTATKSINKGFHLMYQELSELAKLQLDSGRIYLGQKQQTLLKLSETMSIHDVLRFHLH